MGAKVIEVNSSRQGSPIAKLPGGGGMELGDQPILTGVSGGWPPPRRHGAGWGWVGLDAGNVLISSFCAPHIFPKLEIDMN